MITPFFKQMALPGTADFFIFLRARICFPNWNSPGGIRHSRAAGPLTLLLFPSRRIKIVCAYSRVGPHLSQPMEQIQRVETFKNQNLKFKIEKMKRGIECCLARQPKSTGILPASRITVGRNSPARRLRSQGFHCALQEVVLSRSQSPRNKIYLLISSPVKDLIYCKPPLQRLTWGGNFFTVGLPNRESNY
jgi:hypothetical protein